MGLYKADGHYTCGRCEKDIWSPSYYHREKGKISCMDCGKSKPKKSKESTDFYFMDWLLGKLK